MRKIFSAFICCILIDFCFAQTGEDLMIRKTCECLSISINKATGMDEDKFNACFKNDSLFNKNFKKYVSDSLLSNYDDGYVWGKKFFEENQVRLIYECDPWFHFIDSARYDYFKEIDSIDQRNQITTLTALIKINTAKSDLYRQRGLAFFSLLKLDEAKKDFDMALSLPEASSQNLYFRGWINELKGNYDEAVNDYKLARSTSGMSYIDSLIAIVVRKKKDTKKSN